jgi:molybdopterin synthase sulfur carrier subunit
VSIAIQLPVVLREYADSRAEVPVDGADVATALRSLTARYPHLQRHLFTEAGTLRPHVNVYLNQDEVRALPAGELTPLARGDVIHILPSIAGG